MTWTYRVVKHYWRSQAEWHYCVKEIYDGGDSWTLDCMTPCGDTLDELKADLKRMLKATEKPVMVVENDTLKEVADEQDTAD